MITLPDSSKERRLSFRYFKEEEVWKKDLLTTLQLNNLIYSDSKFNKYRNCRSEIYRIASRILKRENIRGSMLTLAHLRSPYILSSLGSQVSGLYINCEIRKDIFPNIQKQIEVMNTSIYADGIYFASVNGDVKDVLNRMKGCFSIIDLDLMINLVSREQALMWGRRISKSLSERAFVMITTGLGFCNKKSTRKLYTEVYRPALIEGIVCPNDKNQEKLISCHLPLSYTDPKKGENGKYIYGGIPQVVEMYVVEPIQGSLIENPIRGKIIVETINV